MLYLVAKRNLMKQPDLEFEKPGAFKYYLCPNQTHEPDKVKPVINCFACAVVFMPQ
jgi:hypothetical protein